MARNAGRAGCKVSITESSTAVKPLNRSWSHRKLHAELNSAGEICRALNSLRGLLQSFCDQEATPAQFHFLRGQALPLVDALENCLRRVRVLAELPDEVRL